MSYKTISCLAKTAEEAAYTSHLACEIAKATGAVLEGAAIIPMLRSVYWDGDPKASETVKTEFLQIASGIEGVLAGEARRTGVDFEWHLIETPESQVAKPLVNFARASDLIVTNAEIGYPLFVSSSQPYEALILDSGRPVLIAPPSGGSVTGVPVMIGWNSSRASAQAVFGALPILQAAKQVFITLIVQAADDKTDSHYSANHISVALARHGVASEVVEVVRSEKSTGEHLFDLAEDRDCGLMVMGGYGHTKFHEAVFGGATRYALEHIRLPTLFAH